LGHDEIVAANPGVDPWLPGNRTRVLLPTQYVLPDAPRKGLVVNLAALRLFYFPKPKVGITDHQSNASSEPASSTMAGTPLTFRTADANLEAIAHDARIPEQTLDVRLRVA
jgi:hypothetical protein